MSELTKTKRNSTEIKENSINQLKELRDYFLNNIENNDWNNYDKVSNLIYELIDLKCESYSEGLTKGIKIAKNVYKK